MTLLVLITSVAPLSHVAAQEKEFRIVRDIPFNEEWIAYQVAIERGWAFVAMKGEIDIEKERLILIGRYFAEKGSQAQPPEVRIRVAMIEESESAQSLDWVKAHYAKFEVNIDKTNYVSQYITDLDISFTAKGESFSGRSMTKIVENRLFLLECVALESAFSSIAENCAAAFRSFEVNTVDKPLLLKEGSSA